ncbi:MAG: 4,5-DOPA dioxygenase extradiol [Thermoplasmata archaeon]|nr:4,5-DOPA dioxygenase extradiol [Thermoplasmata archaeon]MCI4354186.1 4,5-DOPA dioxygenase extradiol [Thermoplasmata archaeon]
MTPEIPATRPRPGAVAPMPAIFVGHGNPMNAIETNAYTEAWQRLAASIPTPRAIVCVSAHWYVRGTRVTAMERPRTIHDFGGFPRPLFEVDYPARGDRKLAERVAELLAPTVVEQDTSWGLDHGAWSVLVRMYPKADVPVVQLALDRTQPPSVHYELGRRLDALRDDGVLILGSGNLVHNLHAYSWGQHPAQPYEWAVDFEQQVVRALSRGEHAPLVAYEGFGESAALSVPTPDHYLPFLYAIATARPGDHFAYPVEGFDGGSISMRAVRIG